MNKACLTPEPVPLIIARSLPLSQLLQGLKIKSTRRAGAFGEPGSGPHLATLLLERGRGVAGVESQLLGRARPKHKSVESP